MALSLIAIVAVLVLLLSPLPSELEGKATATDGDTLRIDGERVRLAGLDAPELHQTCKDESGRDWRCGAAARERLTALLAGERIVCAPQERDRYRRIIARCTAEGADIGARLVAEGLAVAEPEYAAEEAQARDAKRGIWAGTFEAPRSWRDREQGFDLLAWIRSWFG